VPDARSRGGSPGRGSSSAPEGPSRGRGTRRAHPARRLERGFGRRRRRSGRRARRPSSVIFVSFGNPTLRHSGARRRSCLTLRCRHHLAIRHASRLKGSISRIRGAGPVACAPRYRKEFHAVLAPVPPGPPTPRSRRSSNRGEGHRAPGAPPPGEGAAAAGDAPATQPSRPGPVGGSEQGDDEEQLVLVRGAAGDPAPLASGTRPEEVDVSEDGSTHAFSTTKLKNALGAATLPSLFRPPRPVKRTTVFV